MRTRSSSNLPVESSPNPTSLNPKLRNRRRSKQPFILEESPVDTMADQRTIAEFLRAPTEGYAEAIVAPSILAEQFELKHSLINMMNLDEFFRLEKDNTHDHIRWGSPSLARKRTLAFYSHCLAADGNTFPKLRDNIQGYVSTAAVNYNQVIPLSELEKIKRMNEANTKAMQTQINNVKNELRNEMKNSIQASMSNQTNELKNMMARFFQMNTASTSGSGSLPSNTIANPKGELKAITTRSGIVLDGPSVPIPPPFINSEEDELVEETLTDQDLTEYTIKVPHPLVQKPKPPSQRNFVMHQRDPLYPNIPYPSRMHKQKQQDKDEVQIHRFWQMFKQLYINITLVDALILILKYQKMLKALLSNKEKLLELANTPFKENCSTVILKKLPENFRDPGKFLIPYGFSELKCKSLADLEMILRDGDERLTLYMRHDTSSFLNQPQKESINMINIFNDSCEDFLKDLFATNHQSGNPTFSSHPNLTSPKVKDDIFEPEGDMEFADELAFITFPPGNDDLPFDIESDLKEIAYLLNHDPIKEIDSILKDSVDKDNLADLNDNLVDTMPEMFTDEHALYYSSPPLYDEYDDDLFEVESDTAYVYNDPFESKEEKIKESKLLINELDPFKSNKNVKKIAISYASLILEDFDPPLYELPFHKEVPWSKTLLSFYSKIRKKFSNPRFSLLKEFILLFSRNYLIGAIKLSKSLKLLKAR
nr:reverse transcriptase domain-containing protein [Tanacetum cinerariifolium]